MAIGRTNAGGAGGAALNFKVVPGLTQPGTALENTIWVKTESMTGYVFSAETPENPTEGLLWLTIADSSSIKATVPVGNEHITVYFLSGAIYVSGAWETVECMIYQGGVWLSWWDGTLYDAGKEYDQITGGWAQTTYDGLSSGSVSNNADSILLSASNGFSIIATKNAIKIDEYSKLKMILSSISIGSHASAAVAISLHSGPTPTTNNRISQAMVTSNAAEVTMDISGQNGSYWIAVRSQYYAEAAIVKIAME